MGTLHELVVRANGRDQKIRVHNRWLGWDQQHKALVIGSAGALVSLGSVPEAVNRLHQSFHASAPRSARTLEVPDASGAKPVGLLVSLTYRVPRYVRSPQKNPYNWVHWFGDHGERGHGPTDGSDPQYPERYMPLVLRKGSDWFIKRRAGNKYFVTDWLYW